MPKQKYGRPSTGQKGNNRPTVVISRENYDEVDSLSLGTGMSRSAIVDYFISEGLKKARIEEVIIKTKRLVLEDQKGEPMEEITIREDKVSLNGQELKTLTGFEIKSTTEDGYAEVKLTLLAKLT